MQFSKSECINYCDITKNFNITESRVDRLIRNNYLEKVSYEYAHKKKHPLLIVDVYGT